MARTEARSPHLERVTLTGPELQGLDAGLPGASVRLLLPDPGAATVELPTWNGNEFLREDGRRARIRTLTPLRFDAATLELDVEVVVHDDSPLSTWARTARPGTPAAVSGTGAGYDVDPTAEAFLVAGDESALPAISTLLEALPHAADVTVLVEVRSREAVVELPIHPRAEVRWCELAPGADPGDALIEAVVAAPLTDHTRVWAAGEAAAVLRIRRHLGEVGIPRSHANVRGYWKAGRAGT